MAVHEEAPEISEAEAALYDRQIRLWGLDAQRRLRAANVFLAGLKGRPPHEFCKLSAHCYSFLHDHFILLDFFLFPLPSHACTHSLSPGLGCEVAKNVILAGVDKMTICDDENVAKTDFDSAFFLPRDSIGKNRAESAVVVSNKADCLKVA